MNTIRDGEARYGQKGGQSDCTAGTRMTYHNDHPGRYRTRVVAVVAGSAGQEHRLVAPSCFLCRERVNDEDDVTDAIRCAVGAEARRISRRARSGQMGARGVTKQDREREA